MKEESIEEVREIIITSINDSKMEELDKVELMMNIDYFLNHYEEHTKSKVIKKVKYENNSSSK